MLHYYHLIRCKREPVRPQRNSDKPEHYNHMYMNKAFASFHAKNRPLDRLGNKGQG